MADPQIELLPGTLKTYFDKSGVALSLAMLDDAEFPLVMVNRAFTRLTGYAEDEVVGRNCRFLQGPETTADQKKALHDFIHDPACDQGRFPVMNHRKDGSTFFNFVFMTRLRDQSGRDRFILGSQFDMTQAMRQVDLRANDQELQRSLSDIDTIGREFGLAMIGSAQMLADSVVTIARLSFTDDQG